MCPQIIEMPKNMRQHTEESALHKLKYQAKIDSVVKLYQQSIQMVDKEAKSSEIHDEVKEHRFKVLISAAKYNVSTEALAGLCKEWVDKYYGCTFAHTSDAVKK